MATTSTTKPDKQGKQLATRMGDRADSVVNRFTLLWADLDEALERAAEADDEAAIAIAVSAFLISMADIIDSATVESERWIFNQLNSIYGKSSFGNFESLPENIRQGLIGTLRTLEQPDALAFSFAVAEQQRMVSRIRSTIADGQAAARITAAVSGKTVARALREQTIGKADAYNFRKLLDNVTVNTLQQELWLQGQRTFTDIGKIVVATIDGNTTDLCLRLNGTVWGWNELITDPVSGGQRMFAPFTGVPFVPRWHKCRSMAVPYRR